MSETKIGPAIAAGLLFCAGACGQLTVDAEQTPPAPAHSATAGGQDPTSTLATASSTPDSRSYGPPATAPDLQTNTTTATGTTTVRVTKAEAPKATAITTLVKPGPPASTKPTTTPPAVPTFSYSRPSTAGVLTLTCTWDGSRVDALAQWSGAVEIVITVSAPGLTYTSPTPSSGVRVHGSAGQHGACAASGGGQTKSASA